MKLEFSLRTGQAHTGTYFLSRLASETGYTTCHPGKPTNVQIQGENNKELIVRLDFGWLQLRWVCVLAWAFVWASERVWIAATGTG